MKKQFFSLVLIAALMMGCASASGSPSAEGYRSSTSVQGNEMNKTNNNVSELSSIEGNEWKLIEVYIDGKDTLFNRNTLPEELKSFFTLSFDAERISGVGAPNRYSAPYTMGDSQLSIMPVISTMMASFYQPENLTEHEFFVYLQSAYEWKQINNNLELYSKTENGSEVRLVFSL